MADLETFRVEVRAWLDANCPEEMRQPIQDEEDVVWGGKKFNFTEPQKLWLDRMAEKGWTVPEWPVEYGGGGLDKAEAKVLREEMRKIGHSVKKLEARLKESQWLACDQYTLADICNFAIANRMDQGFPEFVNEKDTPAIIDWLGRINERPAAKKMFANQPSEFDRK